jgi:hypothetical protein
MFVNCREWGQKCRRNTAETERKRVSAWPILSGQVTAFTHSCKKRPPSGDGSPMTARPMRDACLSSAGLALRHNRKEGRSGPKGRGRSRPRSPSKPDLPPSPIRHRGANPNGALFLDVHRSPQPVADEVEADRCQENHHTRERRIDRAGVDRCAQCVQHEPPFGLRRFHA